MTSPFHLMPHVRAVSVDEDLVLLDIAEDGYVCIPDAGRGWARRRDDAAEAAVLAEALIEAGLAQPGPGPEPAHPPPAPTTHFDHADAPRFRAVDVYRVFRAWTDYLVDYRGRALIDVLASVRRREIIRAGPTVASPELRRLCATFDRLIIWLPVSGKCLVRSFLLLRFLQRSGHDATWVFGVRVWPFVAHCWLQVGDTALDDRPERLAAYTPIHAA